MVKTYNQYLDIMKIDFNDSFNNFASSSSNLKGGNFLNITPFSVVTSIEACLHALLRQVI